MKARMPSKAFRHAEREPLHGRAFKRRHGVSAVLEGGDFYGGNRREEPSLRDRDPCRVPGSSRYAPALLELVHGRGHAQARQLSSSGASRERRSRDRPQGESQRAWLLTSALITLRAEASARIGEIPSGSALPNADRGRKPRAEEDRELVRVLPVRPFVTAEIGLFGLRPPRCASLRPTPQASDESGSRARASLRGNTSRARFERSVSTSPRWRKKSSSNEEAYLRVRQGFETASARRQGARIDTDGRRLGRQKPRVCFHGGAGRSRLRRVRLMNARLRGRGQGGDRDRDVRGDDRHEAGQRTARLRSSGPAEAGLVGVNRRVPRRGRVRARTRIERREHGWQRTG